MARTPKRPTPPPDTDPNPASRGTHKTPRQPVQFPVEWLKVARKVAAHHRRPTLWVLIELVKKEAEAIGLEDEMPPAPWEEEASG